MVVVVAGQRAAHWVIQTLVHLVTVLVVQHQKPPIAADAKVGLPHLVQVGVVIGGARVHTRGRVIVQDMADIVPVVLAQVQEVLILNVLSVMIQEDVLSPAQPVRTSTTMPHQPYL